MRADAGGAAGWDEVLKAEYAALGVASAGERPLWGLCLSGGGIRSAALGLGLLQGLAEQGWLRRFDYLSTVSGGGYIGAWLSACIQSRGRGEVFAQLRPEQTRTPASIAHLRCFADYLTPRTGVLARDTWTLAATMLRNLLWNWLVFVPLLAAAVLAPWVLKRELQVSAWGLTWAPAAVLLGVFALAAVAALALPESMRERMARWSGGVLLAAAAWCTGCALTLAAPAWLLGLSRGGWRLALAGVAAAASCVSGWLGALAGFRSAATPARAVPAASLAQRALVGAAPAVFIAGLFIALATVVQTCIAPALVVPMLAAALMAARVVNVNACSLQGMYRARLVRAFLPGGDLPLSALAGQRPLPVVNATVNLTAHPRLGWQSRKAALFTATPLHCGSVVTGWRPSRAYAGGLSLGTAMATSGAAVSPNMGYHSSPPLAFLMTLFNLRLGTWLGNPGGRHWRRRSPRTALLWLLREALGLSGAASAYVNLSDGGHFDNLGLYALGQRRCRLIVALDAGCDPGFAFEDLGNAIEKMRVDLGVPIEFDTEQFAALRQGQRRWARARIRYSAVEAGAADGELIYVKPILRGDEPADVVSYASAHAAFPQESTLEQWFSETQMESYRMLGLVSARALAAIPPPGRVAATPVGVQAKSYGEALAVAAASGAAARNGL